jgi:hypothetical protein
MATELYVVQHHGAWRIRDRGRHNGEYPTRDAAVRAAVAFARRAGPDARVFSTGVVSEFRVEWRSDDAAHFLFFERRGSDNEGAARE